jgi:branched-chain amino acid transport system substrate-binding protein
VAWSPGLGTGANRAFQSAFAFGTGRSADAFAVLGYDTAQLILNAAEAAGGDTADTLRAALGTAQFEGPRGQITMDTATQDSAGPLFLREVQQTGTGFHNIVVGELGAIANHDVRVEAARSDLRSGWLNAYLAI